MSKMKDYLGGFFDGEGCISIAKCGCYKNGTHKYHVEIQVSNTVRKPILMYQKLFGGSIYVSKHPPYKDCFKWTVTNKKAKYFLEEMIPYLCIKKDEAEIALKYCGIRKETHVDNIKQLPLEAKEIAINKNLKIREEKQKIFVEWKTCIHKKGRK